MRVGVVEQGSTEFTEFYASARDDCLRIVLLNVGDLQLAEDLVAEGFARAWAPAPQRPGGKKVNDDSALGAVRESLNAAKDALTQTHMDTPLDTIVRRGRSTRRRRGAIGLAGTAAMTASAALVVGLTGITGSAQAHSTGTIRTAAFTLVRHANGTTTLTVNPKELLNAAALQNDLQQDGIRAMVTSGSFCSSDPAPPGFSQVVSFSYPSQPGQFRNPPPGTHPTITFNPAFMPAGSELSFGIFQLSSGEQADFALINSSSYSCTANPLPAGGPANGGQFQVGPTSSYLG